MTEPKEYVFRSFEDILKVPSDRLDVCLAEFMEGLKAAYHMTKLGDEIGDAIGVKSEMHFREFKWIDDEKNNLTINLTEIKVP